MSETFDADWLSLREAADAQARDRASAEGAAAWLAGREQPLRIVDLGAGAANNVAWLAPRLPGPQHWLMVDHDPGLLARAERRASALADREGNRITCTTACRDLLDSSAALPADTDLATASALFDLVSPRWVESLAERCAVVECAALWTLSVDGSWHFESADGRRAETDQDAAMRERLAAHQRRDKGLGPALGGDAPAAIAAAFSRRGYSVATAPSPWRLAPGTELALALLDGWRTALVEQSPLDEASVDAWWRARRSAVERGELGIVVGHVDVWAVPPS